MHNTFVINVFVILCFEIKQKLHSMCIWKSGIWLVYIGKKGGGGCCCVVAYRIFVELCKMLVGGFILLISIFFFFLHCLIQDKSQVAQTTKHISPNKKSSHPVPKMRYTRLSNLTKAEHKLYLDLCQKYSSQQAQPHNQPERFKFNVRQHSTNNKCSKLIQ